MTLKEREVEIAEVERQLHRRETILALVTLLVFVMILLVLMVVPMTDELAIRVVLLILVVAGWVGLGIRLRKGKKLRGSLVREQRLAVGEELKINCIKMIRLEDGYGYVEEAERLVQKYSGLDREEATLGELRAERDRCSKVWDYITIAALLLTVAGAFTAYIAATLGDVDRNICVALMGVPAMLLCLVMWGGGSRENSCNVQCCATEDIIKEKLAGMFCNDNDALEEWEIVGWKKATDGLYQVKGRRVHSL